MLQSSSDVLADRYDLTVLDLDGVVYVGRHAVPGAAEALSAAAARGTHLAYITNNASRTPAAVAEHLGDLGIAARAEDVVTSAQAAARLVSRQVPAGAHVFLIGGAGLDAALRDQQLVPVTDPADEPVAVVQGYGPDMPWRRVVAGAILVRDGLPWVASNLDLTIPTPSGIGPGNGTLVELVARHAEREPQVAGKPARPLFEETLLRVGGTHPVVVGDRLDTDIAGARAMGWDSLLVMTGVTGVPELVGADPEMRPTYVAAGLSALVEPAVAPQQSGDGWECGGWRTGVVRGRLEVSGQGSLDDWWRVVAVAGWTHCDRHGVPPDTDDLHAPSNVTP